MSGGPADAVAATVGDRSWRAWAGRSGGEDFVFSDLFRGAVQAARWHLCAVTAAAPLTATCPICYDESPARWQRFWCGCTVCASCSGRWARAALDSAAGTAMNNQGNRDEGFGDGDNSAAEPPISLTCPACSAPVRACDAANLLKCDAELLSKYDTALRDAALRGMGDYRPCPMCKSGGFVTWSCVEKRRLAARAWANFSGSLLLALLIGVGASRVLSTVAGSDDDALWPRGCLSLSAAAAAAHLLAVSARRAAVDAAADAPLAVGCPDCGSQFAFAATDAAADAAAAHSIGGGGGGSSAHALDDAWVRENTRPCPRPSCRAPILKHGGCNAIRCGRCRLQFCWACMQPMKRCRHFECANGAPFGNASLWDAAAVRDGDRTAAAGQRAAMVSTCAAAVAEILAVVCLVIIGLRAATADSQLAASLASGTDGLLVLPGLIFLEVVENAQHALYALVHASFVLARGALLMLAGLLIALALAEMARGRHAAGRGMRLQDFLEGVLAELARVAHG